MAIIEINSNDLELLQNDFSDIQTKMETLRETLGNDFTLEKQLDLFTNGLNKMDQSMENTSEDAMETVRLIGMFNEEIANIEEVFARKFDDIEVPNIESVDSDVFDQISQGVVSVEPTEEPEMEYNEGGTENEEYSEEYEGVEEVPLYDMGDGEDEIDLSDDSENYEDIEEVPLYDMSDEELAESELEELLRASEQEELGDGENSVDLSDNMASGGAGGMSTGGSYEAVPQVSSVNDTLTDSISEAMANIDLGGGEA